MMAKLDQMDTCLSSLLFMALKAIYMEQYCPWWTSMSDHKEVSRVVRGYMGCTLACIRRRVRIDVK